MAQITYNDVISQPDGYIGFFSLPHDGDSAIVRFMQNDVSDFTILTRHEVGQGKDYRTVDCLRNPHDPVDVCPFCASNVKLAQRFYVKLLRYDTDENGGIVITPCVWERSTRFATTLKGYIDNYGPLQNIVCKIIRKGTGLNTQYEIIPNLSPEIYRPDIYVAKPELFDGYTVVGNAVAAKTADEMRTYLATGRFPENNTDNTPNDVMNSPVPPSVPAYAPVPGNMAGMPTNVQPASWGQTTGNPTPTPQTYVGDFPPAMNTMPTPPVATQAPMPNAPQTYPAPGGQGYDVARPVRHYSS